MTAEKIAVFTTSEIFEQVQEGQRRPRYIHESELKTTVEDSGGTKWNIYSRGSLEHALEQGYTIYVVSTRSRLGNHDFWWIEMAGLENIFLAGEEDTERAAALGWHKLYEKFGFEWPVFRGRPAWWTQARSMLKDSGIKLGYEFERPLTHGEVTW